LSRIFLLKTKYFNFKGKDEHQYSYKTFNKKIKSVFENAVEIKSLKNKKMWASKHEFMIFNANRRNFKSWWKRQRPHDQFEKIHKAATCQYCVVIVDDKIRGKALLNYVKKMKKAKKILLIDHKNYSFKTLLSKFKKRKGKTDIKLVRLHNYNKWAWNKAFDRVFAKKGLLDPRKISYTQKKLAKYRK